MHKLAMCMDYVAMAEDQLADPEIPRSRSVASGLRLEDVRAQDSDSALLCDVSTGQPMVPAVWRHQVFVAVHSLSHPEVKALHQLATQYGATPH